MIWEIIQIILAGGTFFGLYRCYKWIDTIKGVIDKMWARMDLRDQRFKKRDVADKLIVSHEQALTEHRGAIEDHKDHIQELVIKVDRLEAVLRKAADANPSS